jgi:hypothetical protein
MVEPEMLAPPAAGLDPNEPTVVTPPPGATQADPLEYLNSLVDESKAIPPGYEAAAGKETVAMLGN